jgi:tRNA(Ile)-lysidine synthase
LTVRVRRGGETLRLLAGGPRRTVRNLLQEVLLAPWRRERLPIIYLGDKLAAVPGVGVDEQFQAAAGRRGWMPVWEPD